MYPFQKIGYYVNHNSKRHKTNTDLNKNHDEVIGYANKINKSGTSL